MQKAIEILCAELTLRGTLHVPETGRERYPFVAMFHGFSVNRNEDQFMFVRISRELEKAGIGSIRFDFSGSGESEGSFEDVSPSREISEAKCIFKFMSNLEYADKSNLYMLGMSMGGMVASIAAAEVENLKALILWAPAGSMADLIKKIIEENKEYSDEKGRVPFKSLLIGSNFISDINTLDVYGRAARYKGKVLIVHGTQDDVIPIQAAYDYMDVYGTRAELVKIEGSDHGFGKLLWKNTLIDTTVDFILKNI